MRESVFQPGGDGGPDPVCLRAAGDGPHLWTACGWRSAGPSQTGDVQTHTHTHCLSQASMHDQTKQVDSQSPSGNVLMCSPPSPTGSDQHG